MLAHILIREQILLRMGFKYTQLIWQYSKRKKNCLESYLLSSMLEKEEKDVLILKQSVSPQYYHVTLRDYINTPRMNFDGYLL